MQFDYGTFNMITGPRNVNRDRGILNRGPFNVIIGPRNVIMGPWNANTGPWNVIMGLLM